MAVFDVFNSRNAVGALIYLEGVIADLEARVAALEEPEAMIQPLPAEEEKDNG